MADYGGRLQTLGRALEHALQADERRRLLDRSRDPIAALRGAAACA